MLERIRDSFTESIQTKIDAAEALPESIEKAAEMMVPVLAMLSTSQLNY